MTVRPGQVWVPRPDRHLRYQKVVESIEGNRVRIVPYKPDRRIPLKRSKTFPLAQFVSCYRILWHAT